MNFSVGLPITPYDGFVEYIIENAPRIYEVYFSWPGIPNGRSRVNFEGVFSWETETELLSELSRLTEKGIRLNLLLNASCYGAESQSRAFFEKIGEIIEYLNVRFGIGAVTTQSMLIARFVRENFTGLDARASVNTAIGTLDGMRMTAKYFDSFYLRRELNRNLNSVREIGRWCKENDKKLFLLANSGCLNYCPAHVFHDNLVSHESEAVKYDNAYQFTGLCREFLSVSENLTGQKKMFNFIRPEEIPNYNGLAEAVKLATRVNQNPIRQLRAYLNEYYKGNIFDLLEPNLSDIMKEGQ